MRRKTWVIGVLGLTASPLVACQSPSATPAPSPPQPSTKPTRAASQPITPGRADNSARLSEADHAGARRATANHEPKLPSSKGKRTLRLATWNLQWLAAADGHGPVPRTSAHFAQLAQMAKRLNADIIAVQEVESRTAIERVFGPQEYAAFISDTQGTQDVGFVVRRGIQVQQLPDVLELNVGGVRPGADLLVTVDAMHLRLLSVHLKSGCFHGPLSRSKACVKLSAQVRPLETWIDAREREGVDFAVLGDFNREFYSAPRDEVWSQLNDADPPGLELWSPTSQQRSHCWNGRHPDFVDHLVLGGGLKQLASAPSFQELLYEPNTRPKELSDHCPLSIDLHLNVEEAPLDSVPTPTTAAPAAPSIVNAPGLATASPDSPAKPPVLSAAIKGNISHHGKKLYHLPHCPSYTATKIEPARGERWFQSEPEAQAAGWTKAPNCP